MSNWWHSLALFLLAVFSHWVPLATGGLVTAGVGLYERTKGKSLSWETYAFIVGAFALYSVFAAWNDEHANTDKIVLDKGVLSSQISDCKSELRVDGAIIQGKDSLVGSLQGSLAATQASLAALQGPQLQQQASIGTCVAALAKMNPAVHEQVHVVQIMFATVSRKGLIVDQNQQPEAYEIALFVITNQTEPKFQGRLKCQVPFDIVEPPRLPQENLMLMATERSPVAISASEYEISVDQQGVQWGPSHPVYLRVKSQASHLGLCTFSNTQG